MSTPSFTAQALDGGTLRFQSNWTWREVIKGLAGSAPTRAAFTEALSKSEIDAAFWETPPVRAGAEAAPFEMVLVPSKELAGLEADPAPFGKHLERRDPIATFTNLGADAQLVAPTSKGEPSAYPHLLRFLREAPDDQIDALWQALGAAVRTRLAGRCAPLWVSTNGTGVPWLHVRLDDQPKYIQHRPYRTWSGGAG